MSTEILNKNINIIIFASGNGSNAENIIRYFTKTNHNIQFKVITNNQNAGVIKRCENLDIECLIFKKKDFENTKVLKFLEKIKPYLIILAGFLLKIPNSIINNFEKKIVNIHPSLLPKYGGKGMYGINVHKKVIANKEKESGISIHYVNGNYDEGEIIFQKSIEINYPSDSEKLSKKIHKLEMEYLPKTIEKLIKHIHNE